MDDRLIVALDVPNALAGLDLAERLGDAVGFYKIGLGMLTGGGLALANELKGDHGKRIFLDMKLFDIGDVIGVDWRQPLDEVAREQSQHHHPAADPHEHENAVEPGSIVFRASP